MVVVGIVPLALDRDSYPLSTYPMFSSRRTSAETVDTAVLVLGDGTVERLTPDEIAGTDEVIIAAVTVSESIRDDTVADLCAEIAERVGPSDGAATIEVVTETFDAIAWYDGDRVPLDRVVHASCPAVTS